MRTVPNDIRVNGEKIAVRRGRILMTAVRFYPKNYLNPSSTKIPKHRSSKHSDNTKRVFFKRVKSIKSV